MRGYVLLLFRLLIVALVVNSEAPRSEGQPGSLERALWIERLLEASDRASQLRVPSRFPNLPGCPPGSPAFEEWLHNVPENTNMLQSVHGILGQRALQGRDQTAEGRERKRLHYLTIGQVLRGRHRPTADMRLVECSEDRWWSIESPMQSVANTLAAPDFTTKSPQDCGRYIAECPACGDRPITKLNSRHQCYPNGEVVARCRKAEATPVAKVENLRKYRVFTPHEMLSDPVHRRSIQLESFSRHNLAHFPSADFISPELIMPLMLPAQDEAFSASFVVYLVGVAVPWVICEYQAYDNLIRMIHIISDDDCVLTGVNDPAITGEVARVLSGATRKGKIWRIGCRRCPQVGFGAEGLNQSRVPIRPQHSRSKYFPNHLPSWIGDRAQIVRITKSLGSHTVDQGRHNGVFDHCYGSFWELPLAVKRAMLMATYFENMELGKKNNLHGLAVKLMNWRAPE